MPLEPDPNCSHHTVYVCDHCDKIHIASFSADQVCTGQVLVSKENINALIVELMELRGDPKK